MTFTDKQTFKLTENQIATKMGEEYVILNHKKGSYYNLNEVGNLVWALIEETNTFSEIISKIASEFDAEIEIIKGDVAYLINDLIKEELIEAA